MHTEDNIFVRVADYDDQMLLAFSNGHGSTTFKWEWKELPAYVTYIVHQESLRYRYGTHSPPYWHFGQEFSINVPAYLKKSLH